MKAIPTSVKAQFFAMYLGQKAKCIRHFRAERNSIGKDGTLCMSPSILADIHERTFSADDFYLELRSVSDLTNEEKTFIASFSYFGSSTNINQVDILFTHYLNKQSVVSGANWWILQDCLRSIGILLPFTYLNEDKKPVTLSVDELIGMNWAQLTPKAK